jgi:D-arabinose 1-dehydrogenase-like Zn-dependent alcohol dehydrogenase
VALKACTVVVHDLNETAHSLDVTAETLYEAVASEDTLHFCVVTGVRPMIETYPLERAAEAYARMLSGKAEFRVVLTM